MNRPLNILNKLSPYEGGTNVCKDLYLWPLSEYCDVATVSLTKLKNPKLWDVTQHGPHGADRLLVRPDHEGDVAELRQVSQEPHVVTQPGLVTDTIIEISRH